MKSLLPWLLCCSLAVGGTYTVTNEATLRAAYAKLGTEPVNILVSGQIHLTGNTGLNLSANGAAIRMIGITPDATIYFDMIWDGNWSTVAGKNAGGIGLESTGGTVFISKLSFQNLQWCPAALWFNRCKQVVITDCTFGDIGTIIYPPKPAGNTFPLPLWCSSVMLGTCDNWVVSNNKFSRCCWAGNFGQCLYIDGNVSVYDNTFEQCGIIFQTCQYSGSTTITGNTVTNAHRAMRGDGTYPYPYIVTSVNPMVVLGNSWSGYVDGYVHGKALPDSFFGYNDFTGLVLNSPQGPTAWWCDYFAGKWHSQADWVAAGCDTTSKGLPATLPAP